MLSSSLIIFGGTFDPIHNGHLKIATKVAKVFKTPVTFMPTTIPNYKNPPQATNNQRIAMLKLATCHNPDFSVSSYEIMQRIYSPTIKTLTHFRQNLGEKTHIYYIIGADSLINLDTWDNWQQLFALTNFIVLNRPHYDYAQMKALLTYEFNQRKTNNFNDLSHCHGKIYLLDCELCDISSTLIRHNVKLAKDFTQYVPQAVAKYITQYNIYKE